MNTKDESHEQQQSISEVHRVRLEKVKALQEQGINPWGTYQETTATTHEVLEEFDDHTPQEKSYILAGRLMSRRDHGKTIFAHLQDRDGRLQLYIRKDEIGEELFTLLTQLIDAVDISTIHGTDAVGGLVSFRNGKPFKSRYRRFKIKTVEGMDDFGMMREVLYRRFHRLKEEGNKYPDLLLVDGGKGQLSCAMEVLEKLEITTVETVGLAKRLEEVFLPNQSDPQNIPKSSSSLHLLRSIRDEAHRFAVNYHRKLRTKRGVTSKLDHIPGIGPSRRTALLKAFSSVKKIGEASEDDIASIPGISEKLAAVIKKSLQD